MKSIRWIFWIGLLPSLFAQVETGTIAGAVRDNSGAVMPNVTVTFRSQATHLSTKEQTNDAGRFQSPPLSPGLYEVTAEAPSFKKDTSVVTVEVSQRVELNFTMVVGQVTENVIVSASAEQLETETSAFGNVRTEKAVADLPLNARNFAFLITLSPGTVPSFSQDTSSLSATTKRGVNNFAVNGVRPTSEWNSLLIEGIDDAENHNGFGIAVYPPVEAIQEFRIQTSVADAQYGKAAGGFVNLVLKSGAHDFHGALYEFLRNSAFDAKNFFDSPRGKIPHFSLNQFGMTLGGPMVLPGYNQKREKTFFFFSGNGDLRRQALTFISTVPTAAMHTGDFSQYPGKIYDPRTTAVQGTTTTRTPFEGNMIPLSYLDAVGTKIAALYPLPTQPGIVNNYLYNPSRQFDAYQLDFKIDHYFRETDQLTFRGSVGKSDIFDPGAMPAPAAGGGGTGVDGTNSTPVRQFSLTERHTLASNKINEARFGFTRSALNQININAGQDVSSQIGIPGANTGSRLSSGLTILNPTGYRDIGDNGFTPSVLVSNNFQYEDNFSIVHGSHSVRFGARVDRRQYNVYQSSSARGTLNFTGGFTNNPASPAGTGNGFADLLLGAPNNGNIYILDGTRGFRRTELGFYLQDDWKATSRLTVNVGVRYELYPGYPWTEVADRQEQFVVGTGQLVRVGTNGVPRSGTNLDTNNLAPRIGLAWGATGKTVVRTAYGIFYAAPQYEISRNLGTNPPFAGTFSFTNNQLDFVGARRASQGFDRSLNTTGAALNALDPNLRIGYVQQYNLNVERQLPANTVLTVAYVGTKGTKLRDQVNINQARPGPGAVPARRPLPQYGDIQYTEFIGNSTYNALQATLDKRFSRGLLFLVSYTYGHCIDSNPVFGGSHQDSLNLRGDRGNCDWDVRHSFVVSSNYELPFGKNSAKIVSGLIRDWQINGVLRLSTGSPFTATSSNNTLNGSGFQYANVVPGCNPVLPNPAPGLWFNPACFATPPPFTFGNASRNSLYGPGTHQLDFSVFRNIVFKRGDNSKYVQLRGEAFNLTNTPQLNNPASGIGSPTAGVISGAGSPTSFQRTSRQIQLGAKMVW